MSANASPRSRKSLFTTLAFIVALVIAAIVFHKPLVAWFSGKSMGGNGGKSVATQAGPYALKAALDPDPARQQGNALVLDVKDGSGKPVDDAKVAVFFDMPAMGAMAEMKGGAKVSHESGGRYRAEFDLPMGGTWTLKTSIHATQGDAAQDFTFTVGSAGLAAGNASGSAMPTVAASSDGAAAMPGEIDHYTCSMHPSVNQKTPGKCPICGMDLIPVTKEQQQQGVVTIDETRRQLIGVRTAQVVVAPMRSSFRAVGRVAYDESSLTDVNLKVKGWITKLYVNETGQKVTRGQTLFTMYSPELYNAEQDFLLAMKSAANTATPDGGSRIEGFAKASRQRLRLLGLSEGQIEAIAKSGAPVENVAFASPASGFVIEKNVVEGASVEAGTRLYRIGALSKVWVEADVYEADFASVHVGQRADVTLDYLPGRSYDAKVAYVYPSLDEKSRTGRVRIELANKDLDLRPGMYANVALTVDLGERIQVPVGAIVYTGPRRIVFVDLGQGRFKPQEIAIGIEANGMYEVRSGLRAGDVVATSGVFLIAAEARISTAAKYWERTTDDGGAAAPTSAPMPMPMPAIAPPSPSPPPPPRAPARPPSLPSPSVAPPPAPAPAPASATPAVIYTCPMHPEVTSPTPGKCPKCGMDLVPQGRAR
jgi:RND family efflux transporter MFP subunit